jgi:hypothetical protein
MTVPKSEAAPRRNRTQAGNFSRYSGVASGDIVVALGDYTGGASTNMFTLTSHGLSTGDVLYVVDQDTQGAITGGPGTRVVVVVASSSVFQCTTDGTTEIVNTADGTVIFLKGNGVPQRVADTIRSMIICALGDTASGTVEDMFVPFAGWGIAEANTIKLLYKAAAGVAGTLDATTFIRLPVRTVASTYFNSAATAGGAAVATTTDGLAVWLKTS